jgi:hypothetical protein
MVGIATVFAHINSGRYTHSLTLGREYSSRAFTIVVVVLSFMLDEPRRNEFKRANLNEF